MLRLLATDSGAAAKTGNDYDGKTDGRLSIWLSADDRLAPALAVQT